MKTFTLTTEGGTKIEIDVVEETEAVIEINGEKFKIKITKLVE